MEAMGEILGGIDPYNAGHSCHGNGRGGHGGGGDMGEGRVTQIDIVCPCLPNNFQKGTLKLL